MALFAGLLTLLPAGTAPVAAPRCRARHRRRRRRSDGTRSDLEFRWRDHPQLRSRPSVPPRLPRRSFSGTRCDPGDDPSDFDSSRFIAPASGSRARSSGHVQFSIEREMTEREADDPDDAAGSRRGRTSTLRRTITDAAQVRAGKFKIPFGLEQLTGISNLDFVYRSLSANYLAPARDIGVDGARPLLRSRPQLLGRLVSSGRRERAVLEDRRRRRDGRGARDRDCRSASIAGLAKAEVGGAFTVSALDNESVTAQRASRPHRHVPVRVLRAGVRKRPAPTL